ncbi:disulfide bond formation protein DsbA [Nocardia panacis]|uniref:Disulfide bond formation protein DsbA n=1 Tax=Nocardia panacis TaxID=2340916 RepID=A0A3A4KIZ2_9NOCA|nr:thioredoxin domain-containing protein [Nocardia panacis]RJO76594.1 disulfide bond formation protein DsbA [Nocardia panacis]
MSKNPGRKKSAALTKVQGADRNRTILIQVAVAAVLIGLVAAIGVGIAIKKARRDDPGPTPEIAASKSTTELAASITDTGAIRLSKPGAKVTVRMIADLQCPACKTFEGANSQVLEDTVKSGTSAIEYNIISFLDQASGGTEYSSRAANAAYVLAGTDPTKFQDWLARMYAQQPPEGATGLPDSTIIQIAKDAGYNDADITKDITDRKYDKFVKARTKDVFATGVKSTPTVYINGKQLSGQAMAGGLGPAIQAAAGAQ